MKLLKIKTQIFYQLTAHLFEPETSNGSLILINSATGVKQQLYFSIAQFFADHGFTLLTYDYFGIGFSKPENLKKCSASMKSWGEVDFSAMTDFIKTNFPDYKKYCIGHSVGALILGMNKDSSIFDKFIFVATQKAHVSNLRWPIKFQVYSGFGVLQPILTKTLGYFPASLFGIGESLPKNAAQDWRSLLLHKNSTNRLLQFTVNVSKDLNQKTLMIYAEDDSWVTKKGVSSLLSDTYPNLIVQQREILVSESEMKEIGHINFFRSGNGKLWNIILNWL